MSHRLAKINKHIQRLVGEIIQQEADVPPDVLVTVARADTTANLRSSTIWLYIFPLERGVATLEGLKGQIYDLQGSFNHKVHLNPLPRLILRLDMGAAYADTITRKIDQLNH